MPSYSYYLIRTGGGFQTDAEATAYVNDKGERLQPKAKAGDLKFVDVNKDGRLGDGDYEFRGNAMPKLTYAFSGGFTYKKFSLDFMLQGSYGAKLFNAYKYTTLNEAVSSFNRSKEILKALDGPAYDVPRISMIDDNDNFGTISDRYLLFLHRRLAGHRKGRHAQRIHTKRLGEATCSLSKVPPTTSSSAEVSAAGR